MKQKAELLKKSFRCKYCGQVKFDLCSKSIQEVMHVFDKERKEWVVVDNFEVQNEEYYVECKECGDVTSLSLEEAEELEEQLTRGGQDG